MQSEKSPLPPAECFPGTDIPKLTLEQDADLISLIADDPRLQITEEFLGTLNDLAEKGSRDLRLTKNYRNIGFTTSSMLSERQQVTAARRMFYRKLHWLNPDHPISLTDGIQYPRPLTVIRNLRTLYSCIGEGLLDSVSHSRFYGVQALSMTHVTLEERLRGLDEAGLNTAALLRANLRIVISPKFMQTAQATARRLEREAARKEASGAAGKTALEAISHYTPPVVSSEELPLYRQLADCLNLDAEQIAVACSNLQQPPSLIQLEVACEKIQQIVEQDLRLPTLRQLLFMIQSS